MPRGISYQTYEKPCISTLTLYVIICKRSCAAPKCLHRAAWVPVLFENLKRLQSSIHQRVHPRIVRAVKSAWAPSLPKFRETQILKVSGPPMCIGRWERPRKTPNINCDEFTKMNARLILAFDQALFLIHSLRSEQKRACQKDENVNE